LTNADVLEVITGARTAYGRDLTDYDVKVYLGAKEILEREPHNVAAQEVVKNFTTFLRTGENVVSFAEFTLPTPYTDEEKLEQSS
jgi:hypothetical protein